MALDNQFGKGIGVAAGFDLGAQKPLDARVAVNTIAERDAHVENNRAYEGMLVYVAEAGMTYQLVKGEEEGQLVWKEFGFNQNDFDGSFNNAIKDVDDRLKAVEEDLAQGGETEARIAQAESDIDGLQGLVGQPAQAGEGEEEGVPATGLHLALDNVKAELEQDVLDEKERAEGQEAAIRQEMADAIGQHAAEGVEASGLRKEIDDAVAAESALRVAEEQRIEGLVTAEAERAAGKEGELAQAIADEKARAEGKEGELLAAINKEVEDRGAAVQGLADRHDQEMEAAANKVAEDLAALKQELQGEIDSDVAAEAALREAADNALDARVKANEEFIAAQPAKDEAQDNRIKALEDDAPIKQAAIEAAQDAADAAQADVDAVEKRLDDEGGLVDRIEANEANIARLDGAVEVEGSVKKQIKDAIDEVNGAAEALEERVKANEDAIVEINDVIGVPAVEADENGEGAQAATGMHKLIADEDARILAEAKEHAEQKITELVDSAPDAMNTLNELAKAINDNKDVYDGWVIEHNQAMADMKKDLQDEIDADVKVVADELAKQKDAEQEGTLANQIKVEKERAEGQEAAIRQEMATEAQRVDKKIADDIAAESALRVAEEQRIEGLVEAEAGRADAEEKRIVGLVEAEQERAEGKEGELLAAINKEVEDRAAAVNAEKERAEEQEEAIRQEMADAIGQHAAEGVEASGLRKEIDDAVAVEKARAEGQEAAIRGEFAAADTALHNQIRGEMAQVIQSLSASITEDGMLRIALGGIENDEVLVIREQLVPVMNDDDIAELLAGLDEEQGE